MAVETIPLTLKVPGYDIPAALTLPQATGTGAVLLVPGSLFCDVDGNFPTWNSFPRVYGHLAEGLSRRGLAVLRFAKLGPGTGSVETDPVAAPGLRTWAGRAEIARRALALLRSELASRALPARPLVLAGHSEGSVVVSVLARDGVDVDGVVLLSGPSVGILQIMIEQTRAMPGVAPDQVRVLEDVVDAIRRDVPLGAELKARASGPFGAGALVKFPPDALRYMRDVDATDPIAAIANYPKPVLIVQGGADEGVRPHHAEALRRGRGSRPTEYAFFPELQHMYKHVPANVPPQENFGYPGPTDPRVDETIARWVGTLTVR